MVLWLQDGRTLRKALGFSKESCPLSVGGRFGEENGEKGMGKEKSERKTSGVSLPRGRYGSFLEKCTTLGKPVKAS